jgi:hypothetical protein
MAANELLGRGAWRGAEGGLACWRRRGRTTAAGTRGRREAAILALAAAQWGLVDGGWKGDDIEQVGHLLGWLAGTRTHGDLRSLILSFRVQRRGGEDIKLQQKLDQ